MLGNLQLNQERDDDNFDNDVKVYKSGQNYDFTPKVPLKTIEDLRFLVSDENLASVHFGKNLNA